MTIIVVRSGMFLRNRQRECMISDLSTLPTMMAWWTPFFLSRRPHEPMRRMPASLKELQSSGSLGS